MEYGGQDPEARYEMYAIYIGSLLSILGCLFIILSYLFILKLRTTLNKLIACLAFSDLIYSLCKIYSAHLMNFIDSPLKNPFLCKVQGSLIEYSFSLSLFIVLTISFLLYQNIVANSQIVQENIWKFITLSFVVPGFITIYFYYKDAYLPSGPWCFINISEFYIELTLLVHLFYCFCVLATTVFYILIRRKLMADYKLYGEQNYLKMYHRVKWYPIILLLCFIPLFIFRQLSYYGIKLPDIILFLDGVLAILNGFFNSILYGLSSNTRKAIRNLCLRKNQSEYEQSLLSN